MFTALKFARSFREKRAEKQREFEKQKLEQRLEKLREKLNREVAQLEKRLQESERNEEIQRGSAASVAIAVPSSSSANNLNNKVEDVEENQVRGQTLAGVYSSSKKGGHGHEGCSDEDDDVDDGNELAHVQVAKVSNLHFLNVSPVAGGSVASSGNPSPGTSQVKISSPTFFARSYSLEGEDRTRSGASSDVDGRARRISTASCGLGEGEYAHVHQQGQGQGRRISTFSVDDRRLSTFSTIDGFGEGRRISTISANVDMRLPSTETKDGDSYSHRKDKDYYNYKSNITGRMTSNMIGAFVIFTGLLAVVLGFIATEDFSDYSSIVMGIGFLTVVAGFIIIFLGNNRASVIAPKFHKRPESKSKSSTKKKSSITKI